MLHPVTVLSNLHRFAGTTRQRAGHVGDWYFFLAHSYTRPSNSWMSDRPSMYVLELVTQIR